MNVASAKMFKTLWVSPLSLWYWCKVVEITDSKQYWKFFEYHHYHRTLSWHYICENIDSIDQNCRIYRFIPDHVIVKLYDRILTTMVLVLHSVDMTVLTGLAICLAYGVFEGHYLWLIIVVLEMCRTAAMLFSFAVRWLFYWWEYGTEFDCNRHNKILIRARVFYV